MNADFLYAKIMEFLELLELAAQQWSIENQEGFCTHSMKVAAFKAGVKWMRDYYTTQPRFHNNMEAEHPLTPEECFKKE